MDGTLVWEPEERGSRVTIRRMALHYTGSGDVIARHVDLPDAKAIIAAVNCHDELVAALKAIVETHYDDDGVIDVFSASDIVGTDSTGRKQLKGSFIEKLEHARTALAKASA